LRGSIVVVRPDFEVATHYGAYYDKLYVIGEAVKKGIKYVDLYAKDAVKLKFNSAVNDAKVVFIAGTGHGNTSMFTGQNYVPLLMKGNWFDARLVKGKWLSLLSCEFGDSADWWIQNGLNGFFGYNRTYYFNVDEFPDSRAKYFFDSHHMFNVSVLNGKTWQQAFDACIKAYNDAVVNAPYDCKYYLLWDRDSAVARGRMDGNPFKTKADVNLLCRFLKWLWNVSKYSGDVC
jgi:hypothetical protein